MATVNERLSAIETTLKIVVDRLEEDRQYQRSSDRDATIKRDHMAKDIEQIKRDQSDINKWREERVDPFISMGTSVRAKATGAILALGIIGGIVWSGLQYFKEQVINFLGG